MRKLTTALVSTATAAALALSIAPTAVAQSAFSLSSSGSKPAPSGPKNPTPKPGNSTEAKLQKVDGFISEYIKKNGGERSAEYDKVAQSQIDLGKQGKLEWIDASSEEFAIAVAGAYVDGLYVSVLRYDIADLNVVDESLDDLYDDAEGDPFPAGTKLGFAVDADTKYYYMASAGIADTDDSAE